MSNLFDEFAAAYVRGMLPEANEVEDVNSLIALGKQRELKFYYFKRTQELPRVRAILGVLRGVYPQTLLDIGSGRGVFLWPLMDAFPELMVTVVERDPLRAEHLRAVSRGGCNRLNVIEKDAVESCLPDNSVDVVTVLEVLEHLENPIEVAREAVRMASKFVLVSVPSKKDDNPQHIQLFTKASLTYLLENAGALNVNVDYVLNHMIVVARV